MAAQSMQAATRTIAALAIPLAACAGEIVSGEDGEVGPDGGVVPDAGSEDDGAALDCHAWLENRGVAFAPASDAPGVDDPVQVETPIAGIHYRFLGREDRREDLFMDCELARALTRAAPILAERDVVEVTDLGVYNYRCIGGGDPDDGCPNGISQHAYARAIDIAGLTTSGGAHLSVEDDWIIDPEDEPTCDADPEGEKNTVLHELMCELKDDGVFNIVLTPNYNEAHRDHFHVDLTEGGDFIRSRGEHAGPTH